MFLLENALQNYAWGSTSAIAQLQRRGPSQLPEAELWLGAHPKSPSHVHVAGKREALNQAIASDPVAWLGEPVARAFHNELPFLFKALAAATPLSLQAHPSIPQAIAGYAADDAAGIALDAPNRNYRDRNHKPELICALTRFEALCGFRPIAESRELFSWLAVAEVAPLLAPLFDGALTDAAALRATFGGLMSAPREQQSRASDAVARAARHSLATNAGRYAASLRWALALSELYAGDIGVVSSLLLNQVTLQPGQALYLPAGNLHAYLEGLGMELMANSDNVLRGGCTPKHVDVPELLKVLDFGSGSVEILQPVEQTPGVRRYITAAAEFELTELRVVGSLTPAAQITGPEILFVAEGDVRVEDGENALELAQGQSVFMRPSTVPYTLRADSAKLYRAGVPLRSSAV